MGAGSLAPDRHPAAGAGINAWSHQLGQRPGNRPLKAEGLRQNQMAPGGLRSRLPRASRTLSHPHLVQAAGPQASLW